MSTDIIIRLNSLRCLRESDGSGGSEPYMWPALLWVDEAAQVRVTGPALGNARVVVKGNMRAGQSAAVPASVGVSRVRVERIETVRAAFVVVALWENDDTPDRALHAGFNAFYGELRAAVAANLAALASAGPDDRKRIIAAIQARVAGKVRTAISDGLSAFEKAQVGLGLLNLDDIVGSAFIGSAGPPVPAPLTFDLESGDRTNRYQILGNLEVRPVAVDRCQGRVDAVRAAQATVDGINAEIRQLQVELRDASPGAKPGIIREIGRIRAQELVPAKAAFEDAEKALQACRNGGPPVAPDPGESAMATV